MPRVPPVEPRGKPDAESLIREHQVEIWRYLRLLGASAADADDLLQETFLRFLRRTVDPRAIRATLRTIARGLWVDRHRWLQRRRAVRWADAVERVVVATSDTNQEIWLEALGACREKLTDRARRALELAYCHGRGRNEMARELGLAPNTVRNLLATTREVLRQCIEKRVGLEQGDER